MIDKIELRLSPFIDFTPTVRSLLRGIGIAVSGGHYSGVLDLRPIGIPALLHYRKRRGEKSHKLEFLETGKMVYSEFVAVIEAVVDTDIEGLELMRLDLCADLPNVSMQWVRDSCRIRFKRKHQQIGVIKQRQISGVEIETLVFGSRPSVLRAYNKVELWQKQFRKDCKKQSIDADVLEFEREYGIPYDATLSRFERQYGGGRLPPEVPTFGAIPAVVDIDPFSDVEILPGTRISPRIEDYDFSEWLIGTRLRDEAIRRGAQEFRRWLNNYSNGNAARYLKRYAVFMPESDLPGISKAEITKIYRDSTLLQLSR